METTFENNTLREDQEIMNGIAEGMPEALERLHRQYRAAMKAVIMQVLHDDSEADDVLQDVLVQIWTRPEAYSANKGKLISWLCTLARRRAIDRLRQHSAYRRATDRFELSCSRETEEASQSHTVERDAYRDEIRELLVKHLSALPQQQEQAVRMAFLENRSQREIAALTNTPLGTVKTRIELGMKKLSNALSGMQSEVL